MMNEKIYRVYRNGLLTEKSFTVRRDALIAAAEMWKEKGGNVIVSCFVHNTFVCIERTITEDGKFK